MLTLLLRYETRWYNEQNSLKEEFRSTETFKDHVNSLTTWDLIHELGDLD